MFVCHLRICCLCGFHTPMEKEKDRTWQSENRIPGENGKGEDANLQGVAQKYVQELFRDGISEAADASGLDHLDHLVNEGQGAMLYSGHFGNFPLMMLWLAIKGYPVATIYKEAKNFPENFFGNIMKRFNLAPLKYESEASVTVAIIRALKEKKIVLIQNDQSHPFGIYVNFFNKSVPSPAGPALLAKRVGVPVVPAYIVRDKSNRHHIAVLPEIVLQQEDDLEKFMAINTQILIDWIAGILVEHPSEWLWLHNRWKRARPSQ